MAVLIKDRAILTDPWRLLNGVDVLVALAGAGDVIVPLAIWREHRHSLVDRDGRMGVWLGPTDDPLQIGDFPPLIAVHFPTFTDGRGYSTARILRERLGFRGELRAVGDILRDQLFELERCGFDAFSLRADQDAKAALNAFNNFTEAYQGAADRQPLFARRFEFKKERFMTLQKRIDEASARLRDVVEAHSPACFASSFGAEDMVILDLIDRLELDVDVFTLDTGRLHEETHALIALAIKKYRKPIRIMVPGTEQIESFVLANGNNAFYDSVELRKACCEIRKLAPLRRALHGKRLWITGLRREQSVTRGSAVVLSHDDENGLFKLNPLVDWSSSDVFGYLDRFEVPRNALHARGFPSIGCAPCTRAVADGDDERAGRWWWELPESRECGLHMNPQGRLVRKSTALTESA